MLSWLAGRRPFLKTCYKFQTGARVAFWRQNLLENESSRRPRTSRTVTSATESHSCFRISSSVCSIPKALPRFRCGGCESRSAISFRHIPLIFYLNLICGVLGFWGYLRTSYCTGEFVACSRLSSRMLVLV